MRTTMRLDKLLATSGFGTRKDVKKLLHAGVVTVNDSAVTVADIQVDPDSDIVAVDGNVLCIRNHVYLMMNKPSGVVSSTKDGEHQTVLDIVGEEYQHRFPGGELHMVGRLDIDTEGFLLLTTDGSLTHRLTSPKTHVAKTYYVELRDAVPQDLQKSYMIQFNKGLNIPPENNENGFRSQSAQLVWLSEKICSLIIYEGKYHQVKRMFASLDNEVLYLKRTAVGSVFLDTELQPGSYRELSAAELSLLQ